MRKDKTKSAPVLMRGQVWFLWENDATALEKIEDPNNHILSKSRPWLIISRDETLKTSELVNLVPMSSRADPEFAGHVSYIDPVRGYMQVVCCEQPRTVSKEYLLQYGKKIFDVPNWVLDEATKKAAYQFYGKEDFFQEAILQFMSIISASTVEQVKLMKCIVENMGKGVVKDTSVEVKVNPAQRTKNKTWSDDKILQFVLDSESMSRDKMKEKYEINADSTYYAYLKKFKKLLGCTPE